MAWYILNSTAEKYGTAPDDVIVVIMPGVEFVDI